MEDLLTAGLQPGKDSLAGWVLFYPGSAKRDRSNAHSHERMIYPVPAYSLSSISRTLFKR